MLSNKHASAASWKIPESVLVVIHSVDMHILLLERADHPGFWQSVTGSRDTLDEPLRQTCVREVHEETGLVIGSDSVPLNALVDAHRQRHYEIYPRWRHRYAPGVTHNVEHVFSLVIARDMTITLSPREHLQCTWLPCADAAQRCFSPSNADAIRQLQAQATTR